MAILNTISWHKMLSRLQGSTRTYYFCQTKLNCNQILKCRSAMTCTGTTQRSSNISQNKSFKTILNRQISTYNFPFRKSFFQTQLTNIQGKGKSLFHTSPRRHVIPPFLLALMKPITKVSVALFARFARKRYSNLDTTKKRAILQKIKQFWYIPVGVVSSLVGFGIIFYFTHIEETPLTGRKRFVVFTQSQILKIADQDCQNMLESYKDEILGENTLQVQRVRSVMMRLIEANPELNSNLPFTDWKINVINHHLCNACVMPNGHVFVFNGILDLARTQDELAIVLGHEASHAVLSHSIEELSRAALVNYFTIIVLAAIWCLLPNDGIAAFSHWFYNKVIQLTTHLPHSRKIEKEADKVGLMFTAKACFDVRVGSLLWKKMSLREKLERTAEDLPEWMSTHPDSEKRAAHLDFLLPQAEEWRSSMKCPILSSSDPREVIVAVSKEVDNLLVARKAGQNLAQVEKVPSC